MKTFLRAFLAAFLLLLQLPLFAQSISWQQLSGPAGGSGSFVQAGKDGFLFTILYDNLLYRSADGGLNWQKMPQTPANIWYWPLSVGYDGNLYAGKSYELHRSVNDGQSWTKLNFNNGSVEAATGLPGNVILVGSYGKIYRSGDGGQTWTTHSLSSQGFDRLTYNPTTDHVYAWESSPATNTGTVYRSTDKGLTWTTFFNTAGVEPYSMAFAPNGTVFIGATDYIWKTTDGGATWTSTLLWDQSGVSEIQLAVTSTGRVFAQQWYRSFYSDDNGSTWKEYQDAQGNYMEVFSTLPNGALFAVWSGGSLRRSMDNGSTWVFAANGMKDGAITDVAFPENGKILASTYDGLFYSADNGSTWQLLYDKMNLESYPIPFVEASPTGDWYFYDGKNVLRFTDDGQQQQIVNNPLSAFDDPDDIKIHPQTGTVFLLAWSSLFRSIDSGTTWQELDQRALDLIFMPDGSIIATGFGILTKSTDDGLTWQTISTFPTENPVASPSGELYDMRTWPATSIWHSIDGGSTWDSIPTNETFVTPKLTVNAAGHLFVIDDFGEQLLRSVDGGFTFNATALPIEYAYNAQLRVAPDQRLYLLTEGSGLHRSTAPTTNVTLMKGEVFADLDKNCAFAAPDTTTKGWPVKAVRGTETVYGFVGLSGKYSLPVGTGNYEVSVVTPNDYWASCKTTASAVAGGGTVDGVNVGIQALIECPYMEVDVAAPFLRRCFEGQITILYCNKGTAPAVGAYVEVTLDSFLIFNSSTLPVASQSGRTYRFNLGDVAVGECGNFRIRCTPSCEAALGEIHCIEAHIYPDEICPPLPRPQVRTSAVCTGDSIRLTVQNVGTAPMSVPRSWRALDPDDYQPPFAPLASGTFQLGAGQSLVRSVAARPRLHLVAEQDPAYPYNVVSQTEVSNCGSNSGSDPLSVVSADEEGPFTDVLCLPNQGSFDPNDKTGYPLGIADKHYIAHEQDLEYLIRFQNTGTDTAFNITVCDTLPLVLLDPASVRPGASSHPYTFSVSPRGVLLFTFQNILLPDSNINEAASHGFVQFRVAQQPNTAKGSSIRNRAAIYFDFNEPVITNTTLHTVGIPALVSVRPEAAAPEITLDASPNPMPQRTTLTLRGTVPSSDLQLECYDSANRLMRTQTFQGSSVVVERDAWPSGVYSFVLKTSTGAIIGSCQVVAQ